MTLGIVKRTEEEFADWIGTEWGFAEGLLSYDDEPIARIPLTRSAASAFT